MILKSTSNQADGGRNPARTWRQSGGYFVASFELIWVRHSQGTQLDGAVEQEGKVSLHSTSLEVESSWRCEIFKNAEKALKNQENL